MNDSIIMGFAVDTYSAQRIVSMKFMELVLYFHKLFILDVSLCGTLRLKCQLYTHVLYNLMTMKFAEHINGCMQFEAQ